MGCDFSTETRLEELTSPSGKGGGTGTGGTSTGGTTPTTPNGAPTNSTPNNKNSKLATNRPSPIVPPALPAKLLRPSPHGAAAPVDIASEAERRVAAEKAALIAAANRSDRTSPKFSPKQNQHHTHKDGSSPLHRGATGATGATDGSGSPLRTATDATALNPDGTDKPPTLLPPHSILLKQLSDVKEIAETEESRLFGMSGSPPVSGAITPMNAQNQQRRLHTLTRLNSNDTNNTTTGGGVGISPRPPPLLHAPSSGNSKPNVPHQPTTPGGGGSTTPHHHHHSMSLGAGMAHHSHFPHSQHLPNSGGHRTPSRSLTALPPVAGTHSPGTVSPMNVRPTHNTTSPPPRSFFPSSMHVPAPAPTLSPPPPAPVESIALVQLPLQTQVSLPASASAYVVPTEPVVPALPTAAFVTPIAERTTTATTTSAERAGSTSSSPFDASAHVTPPLSLVRGSTPEVGAGSGVVSTTVSVGVSGSATLT